VEVLRSLLFRLEPASQNLQKKQTTRAHNLSTLVCSDILALFPSTSIWKPGAHCLRMVGSLGAPRANQIALIRRAFAESLSLGAAGAALRPEWSTHLRVPELPRIPDSSPTLRLHVESVPQHEHATHSSTLLLCLRKIQTQLRPRDPPLFPLHQAQRLVRLRKRTLDSVAAARCTRGIRRPDWLPVGFTRPI
jgi:hypothetical protein